MKKPENFRYCRIVLVRTLAREDAKRDHRNEYATGKSDPLDSGPPARHNSRLQSGKPSAREELWNSNHQRSYRHDDREGAYSSSLESPQGGEMRRRAYARVLLQL